MPRISIIAAIGKNRELGFRQELIWRIPEDLKRFKALTMGHPIIMGKRTFESIGYPLPGRTNIVITNDSAWKRGEVAAIHSLEEALSVAKEKDRKEIFIIGGASVYAQALPFADRLYLTLIDAASEADVWFPEYTAFTKVIHKEEKSYQGLTYYFNVLERS